MTIILALLSLVFFSCREEIDIPNFDRFAWQKDDLGCNGIRAEAVDLLLSHKKNLKGKSELQVMNYLGKPDRAELGQRNKKYFIYYIEPGTQCENKENDGSRYLRIAFNSVRLSDEVVIVR